MNTIKQLSEHLQQLGREEELSTEKEIESLSDEEILELLKSR